MNFNWTAKILNMVIESMDNRQGSLVWHGESPNPSGERIHTNQNERVTMKTTKGSRYINVHVLKTLAWHCYKSDR